MGKTSLDKASISLRKLIEQDRTVTFGKKPNDLTLEQSLREETRNALDAAGNAALHIRFFNLLLAEKISKIEKIKKLDDQFEIANLKPSDLNYVTKLNETSINKLNAKEVIELRRYLSLQIGQSKSLVDNYKKKVKKAEEDLKKQETKLAEINKEVIELRRYLSLQIGQSKSLVDNYNKKVKKAEEDLKKQETKLAEIYKMIQLEKLQKKKKRN